MFIIDFDDTLFDTHAFKQARLSALKNIGVNEELFWKTYNQARTDGEGIFAYSDRRHAQFLALENFDEEEIFGELKKVSENVHNFLFSDTVDFLEFLKKYNQTIILLSLGDPVFQELKLYGTKIHDYFSHVFMVNESKDKVLEEIFKFEKVDTAWFVNDKVAETELLVKKFPVLKPILKVSPSINKVEYINSGIPHFNTLKEIQDYVARSV